MNRLKSNQISLKNINLDALRGQLNKPLTTFILGLILGMILGLPILGWWLFPVEWKDASVAHLRQDLKSDYLRMAVDSYAVNQNKQQAQQRWKELGADAIKLFTAAQADPTYNANNLANFSNAIKGPDGVIQQPGSADSSQSQPGAAATPAAGAPTTAANNGGINLVYVLGAFCLLTLLIGGALVYVIIIRKRPSGSGAASADEEIDEEAQAVEKIHPSATHAADRAAYEDEGEQMPVAQFMTTYMLGDDLYDDSFSIDSPTGEFLGECGVGISDTIGVGDPKKVTAFEVWLFDKNDIQTITKVLMSDHAYNDPTISQRLLSKGEPVRIEAGQTVLLETATLQLEARVVDLNYGHGALPEGSFFERLTLELAVWSKA